MANHKSAEKRNRQSQVARLRNQANRTAMKTSLKKLDLAIEAGEGTKEALQEAISRIAKTASKGTLKKKTASRKISRLTKRVNAALAA
ncbi:MAG: 30S ribosomal protein S20 [Desulfotalea sp.]